MPEVQLLSDELYTWTVSGLFFMAGAVLGSFGSVLLHRIPRGESIVTPRSHCTHCGHTLGPLDLVPVVSYLWLRGRSRCCKTPISAIYVLLEGLLGTAGALVAYGWGPVAAGTICLSMVAVLLGVAKQKRSALLRDQRGLGLVEVLVATLLLTLAVTSVFEVIRLSRRSQFVTYQRTEAVGLARAAFAQVAQEASAMGSGQHPQDDSWSEGKYQITTTIRHDSAPSTYWVTVSVTCPECRKLGGTGGANVELTGVVGRWQ